MIGAKAGHILTRKGTRYRGSAIKGYERVLNLHVLPALGDRRISDLKRSAVQGWIDALVASGADPSTISNALDPLRRICDRAVKRDLIPFSPCQHLDVPRARGRRERIASPVEAAALIAALPTEDKALWATFMYSGLRVSEARALRWTDVDLDSNVFRVQRTWTDDGGEEDGTKSGWDAHRIVAIIPELRPLIVAHMLATGRRGDDLVFGRTARLPLVRSTVRNRAVRAWKRAGLNAIQPHECRHSFGSLLAAAGVNAGERQRQMGHASSAMMDRYTHGFDGSVTEAGERVQRFIDTYREEAAG